MSHMLIITFIIMLFFKNKLTCKMYFYYEICNNPQNGKQDEENDFGYTSGIGSVLPYDFSSICKERF